MKLLLIMGFKIWIKDFKLKSAATTNRIKVSGRYDRFVKPVTKSHSHCKVGPFKGAVYLWNIWLFRQPGGRVDCVWQEVREHSGTFPAPCHLAHHCCSTCSRCQEVGPQPPCWTPSCSDTETDIREHTKQISKKIYNNIYNIMKSWQKLLRDLLFLALRKVRSETANLRLCSAQHPRDTSVSKHTTEIQSVAGV